MVQIDSVRVHSWDVPMRSPYRSAQRLTTTAHNVLVSLRLTNGTTGYGESAPATYVTGETQDSVRQGIEAIAPLLIGLSPESALERLALQALTPGSQAALETALLDATARAAGMPFYHVLLPGLTQAGAKPETLPSFVTTHPTDLSLPILTTEETVARAQAAVEAGFRCLKLKVGGDVANEIARVQAVADAVPSVTLRLDGNQAFTPEDAVRLLDGLSELVLRIELLEQPTRANDDAAMRFVQERVPVAVFADESVHNAGDAARLVGEGICRGVVLKLAKSAIRETLSIGHAVHAAGGSCLFGCMLETRLGITAALHVAVALGPEIVPLFDLDGHLLVQDDALLSGGLIQTGDRLSVDPPTPGLNVTIL